MKHSRLRMAVPLVVTLALLFLVLRVVKPLELTETLSEVSPGWALVAALAAFSFIAARAWRYRLLLGNGQPRRLRTILAVTLSSWGASCSATSEIRATRARAPGCNSTRRSSGRPLGGRRPGMTLPCGQVDGWPRCSSRRSSTVLDMPGASTAASRSAVAQSMPRPSVSHRSTIRWRRTMSAAAAASAGAAAAVPT